MDSDPLTGRVRIQPHQTTSAVATDIKQFDPGASGVKRADTSQRMRKAHEAAAHDAWFRAQVEQGLQEADDPSTQWVSNAAVKASSAKRRAAWAKKVQAGA